MLSFNLCSAWVLYRNKSDAKSFLVKERENKKQQRNGKTSAKVSTENKHHIHLNSEYLSGKLLNKLLCAIGKCLPGLIQSLDVGAYAETNGNSFKVAYKSI